MFQYIPKTMGIKEKIELENAQRDLEKARATMDYIAMMADIELIDESENETEGGIHDESEV